MFSSVQVDTLLVFVHSFFLNVPFSLEVPHCWGYLFASCKVLSVYHLPIIEIYVLIDFLDDGFFGTHFCCLLSLFGDIKLCTCCFLRQTQLGSIYWLAYQGHFRAWYHSIICYLLIYLSWWRCWRLLFLRLSLHDALLHFWWNINPPSIFWFCWQWE